MPTFGKEPISLQSKISADDICDKCQTDRLYRLANIVWPNIIKHRIKYHHLYPSEYFIKVILSMCVIDDYIVNPPIEIEPGRINSYHYIPLHYNKLLIMDALMHQGSQPRYLTKEGRFIYSEHSGGISLKNKVVDNIIVSAESNRTDAADVNIFLPINADILAQYEYLFHTHPNTSTYAGRIKDGIIYEFPSANDLFNFVKYHTEGAAMASLIIAPEGMYVIRQIKYRKFDVNYEFFYRLRKFILKLERAAIKELQPYMPQLSDPDFFHKYVGSNFKYIKLYNKFIEPVNLFIEYYPRQKRNNEWNLRQISLAYVDPE